MTYMYWSAHVHLQGTSTLEKAEVDKGDLQEEHKGKKEFDDAVVENVVTKVNVQ